MTYPSRPRPRDWAPLAPTDPLPGDPVAIGAEAKRLRNMGAEMRAQIATLREIGSEANLVGQYAEKLRSSATDLAGKLEKSVGRYEQVSAHLEKWAPELAGYQDTTLRALDKAMAAEEIRTATAPVTPQDPVATAAAQCALDDAECMMRQARDQMMTAVEDARRRGREIADLIDDATDDDVKDGFWDNFKDVISRNASWLKDVTKWLGYITTGLAVIAIFVPGLNMIVLGYTLVLAAGHLALALSGDGSWADLAFDAVALATFGMGARLAKGMKSAHSAARSGTARAASRAAEKEALKNSRSARSAAGNLASGSGSQAAAARETIRAAKAEARAAGARAAREVREAPLPKADVGARFAAKDVETAPRMLDVDAMQKRFPGDIRIAAAADEFGEDLLRYQRVWTAGAVSDLGDKAGEGLGGGYDTFKTHFTAEAGSTW